ncbi:hypothetical protein MXL26_09980 [Acinetobacter towneri]|uniref:hypothetical protein n=1 Tax=Acinetobacter towneri TaxID=202956 RepID=UPI002DBD69D3|nr:hypothetical protein [Acinetobacter towneri]MEB6565668.1 hypothetical protein [Acinetobacter towneri]
MISTICLHELPAEQLKKMSPENIDQTLKDEQPYFQHHPKTTDSLAINGSKTKQDGLVKASATPRKIGGLSVVLVGEDVIYTDDTTTKTISSVGQVCIVEGVDHG